MPQSGFTNVYAQPIYDTVHIPVLAAIGGIVTLFTIPYGGLLAPAVPKTFAHTNIVQAGRLEEGVSLLITGVTAHIRELECVAAVRYSEVDTRAIQQGLFTLEIGQREFLKVPLACIPGGGAELVLFSNIAPAVTEWQMTRGVSAHQNRYHLDVPIELDSQETILVRISDLGVVAAVTDLTVVLWGTMTRPAR